MEFIFRVKTDKGYQEAVASLETVLVEHKFGVLWKLDVRDKLAEKGVDLDRQVKILEVCNPHKAKAVLERDLRVSYFLPCKLVVYVENGQTIMGMVRPTLFMEMLDNPDLRQFALEVEDTLQAVLTAAV